MAANSRPMFGVKRIAIAALMLSLVAIAAAYVGVLISDTAPTWTAWALAIAISVATVALMTIGAVRRDGTLGRAALSFAFVFLVLLGGFILALVLPAANEPLWFGLPRRAAIVLYGIGLIPLMVLPLTYAATFDDSSLSVDDEEPRT